MYLNEVMEIQTLPRYTNSDDDFIMASHLKEKYESLKCFIESDGGMSCLDCHNPHISIKNTNIINYNNSCYSCHNQEACTEIKIERLAVNDNCVSCHMKESKTIDIPHVTITDHKIKINKKRDLNNGLKNFSN